MNDKILKIKDTKDPNSEALRLRAIGTMSFATAQCV